MMTGRESNPQVDLPCFLRHFSMLWVLPRPVIVYPQLESNQHQGFRKPLFYPLNYEGFARLPES